MSRMINCFRSRVLVLSKLISFQIVCFIMIRRIADWMPVTHRVKNQISTIQSAISFYYLPLLKLRELLLDLALDLAFDVAAL